MALSCSWFTETRIETIFASLAIEMLRQTWRSKKIITHIFFWNSKSRHFWIGIFLKKWSNFIKIKFFQWHLYGMPTMIRIQGSGPSVVEQTETSAGLQVLESISLNFLNFKVKILENQTIKQGFWIHLALMWFRTPCKTSVLDKLF